MNSYYHSNVNIKWSDHVNSNNEGAVNGHFETEKMTFASCKHKDVNTENWNLKLDFTFEKQKKKHSQSRTMIHRVLFNRWNRKLRAIEQ